MTENEKLIVKTIREDRKAYRDTVLPLNLSHIAMNNIIAKESWEEAFSRLQAENAALRERLKKAIILPCRIGDKFYVVNYYPPELNEEECCDFSFIELSKILLDNGCGVTYELGDNGCFFVTLDKNEAIRIYNQKKEEQND